MSNEAPLVFWRDAFILEVLHGPLSLRIRAHSDGATDSSSAEEAAKAALGALEELAPLRRMLATPAWRLRPSPEWPRVLRLMVDAALQTGDHTLTPMAAVAGSIAQVALEAGMHVGVGTMVGTDTPNVDSSTDLTAGFPAHVALLGNGLLIVENLRALDRLGAGRVDCAFLPLPLSASDGAPVRAIAWPRAETAAA